MASAVEYFKGAPCWQCRKPVNDNKGTLIAITTHYGSSGFKFEIIHTSPYSCFKKFERYGGLKNIAGVAATFDEVGLIKRPAFEDFAKRSFRVFATPQEIADKIKKYSKNNCLYTDAKINGACKEELARLGINAEDITKALLLYSNTTHSDLGELIEELKNAPTFGAEAILIQNTSSQENTYVLPFFKEPITPKLMQEFGLKLKIRV